MAICGVISGERKISFSSAPDLEMMADSETSAPLPAVVGSATNSEACGCIALPAPAIASTGPGLASSMPLPPKLTWLRNAAAASAGDPTCHATEQPESLT